MTGPYQVRIWLDRRGPPRTVALTDTREGAEDFARSFARRAGVFEAGVVDRWGRERETRFRG